MFIAPITGALDCKPKIQGMSNAKFRKSIHSEVHMQIRDFFIKKRKEQGLSQRGLAQLLNITHSLIGKIETGDRRLDVVEAIEYCYYLNINPNELISLIKKYL